MAFLLWANSINRPRLASHKSHLNIAYFHDYIDCTLENNSMNRPRLVIAYVHDYTDRAFRIVQFTLRMSNLTKCNRKRRTCLCNIPVIFRHKNKSLPWIIFFLSRRIYPVFCIDLHQHFNQLRSYIERFTRVNVQ